jgi:hypothetical protein
VEKFIPIRPGIDLGSGFNSLTGEVRGVAVGGAIADATDSGQKVKANVTVIESQEQMTESLNVSVEASGHYGLFSAEGRFGLAQQSSYTAQSTYVVAECVVENPFRSFVRPAILDEAGQRLREQGPDSFKAGYGNSFVRGIRSGGELYAVFQLTSASTEDQKHVAVSLQAELQGLFAGGSVSASVDYLTKTSSKVSSMSVLFYQRAGNNNSISPVTTPGEITQRLKDFPSIAKSAPVGYIAQIMDYQVLALPSFDEVGFYQRTEALEDYARLKVKFLGMRAEIDLVRRNPAIFFSDYADPALAKGYDLYTRAVNMLNRHARRVANKEIEPLLFDAGSYDQELKELPIFLFKKKAPESDVVTVPNVLGLTVAQAQELLKSYGLNPTSNATAVKKDSGVPLNIVMTQTPGYGESLPKGSSVVISYNYIEDQRFPWMIDNRLYVTNRATFAVLARS